MNRTITFLLLTAALMAGLGWFFDRRGSDTSEEATQKNAMGETAIGGPVFWPSEPKEPMEPATDGMVDLYLEVSSMDGVDQLPAANVDLEVFFESDGMLSYGPFTQHAASLGTFQTDEKGSAHFRLKLPVSPRNQLPIKGALFVCAAKVGWQKPAEAWFRCKPQMDHTIRQPLVLHRGATIRVRPLGYDSEESQPNFIGPILSVQILDGEGDEQFIPFLPSEPMGLGMPVAHLSISQKGRYRLFARSPEGVGLVPSILLDPANPPEEVTILFEDFGSIAGKVNLPPNFPTKWPLVLRAVAEKKVGVESLLWDTGFTSEDYPATIATGLVQEDGSFRVAGLAPGDYRLGFPDLGPPGSSSGWFSEASFQTGSNRVELELPATFLEIAFVRGEESKNALDPTRVALTEFYLSSSAYPDMMFSPEQVVGPNGRMGYYLLPGTAYRFLAYGKDLPVFEVQLPASFPTPIWTVKIPNPEPAFGFLEWDGPSENVMYEILTPELGLVLDTWDSSLGNIPGAMRRQLPPGRYRMRGFGINGSEFACLEQWAEVVAGETAQLDFDFPQAGWMEITLNLDGEGEIQSPNPVLGPMEGDESLRLTYRRSGYSRWIMRPRDGSSPIGLTFSSESPGQGMWHTVNMKPGETKRADECFTPGVYDLDVMVQGYLPQTMEVEIRATELTEISVALEPQ